MYERDKQDTCTQAATTIQLNIIYGLAVAPPHGYSIKKKTVQPVYSCCCWRRAPRGRNPACITACSTSSAGVWWGVASRAHLLRAHLSTTKRTARVQRRERTAPTTRDTPPIGTSMVSILKLPQRREWPPPPPPRGGQSTVCLCCCGFGSGHHSD